MMYAPSSANPPVWQSLAQLNSAGVWSTVYKHRFRHQVSTARVKQTTTHTPPASNSWQTVPWDVLDYDTDIIWTNPNFVAPVTGYYQVTFGVICATAPAANRLIGIAVVGVGIMADADISAWGQTVTWEGQLSAGMQVEPQILNFNVADLTLGVGSFCTFRYVGE
jgi:hypothetical protein